MNRPRKLSLTMLIIGLVAAVGTGAPDAQASPPVWGDLEPGEHAIGFRTMETYDDARTMRAKRDYFGNPVEGERARPLQALIWYPAVATPDAVLMTLGEYVFPNPEDERFFRIIAAVQNRELQAYGVVWGDQGLVLDAMSVEMGAVRDAPAAEGSFPLIVYQPDLTNGFSDNAVLCEYLASHGFVVVSTHSVGTGTLNPAATAVDIETLVRDRELALAMARGLNVVDPGKLGLLGHGAGGLMSLLLQMRNYDVDAVVTLDGWQTRADQTEFVLGNPFFDAYRADVPTLNVIGSREDAHDLSPVDSCKYSERYTLELEDTTGACFSSYAAVREIVGDGIEGPESISRPVYDEICGRTGAFLDRFLKGDSTVLAVIGAPSATAEERPPTSEQFVQICRRNGGVAAKEIYDRFHALDPGCIPIDEQTFNTLGYQALQRGNGADAMALFGINAATYPGSANCWDSYADGCIGAGDTAMAVTCYEKLLEVLPDDPAPNDQLRETLRTNATQGIERLKQ